MTWEFGLAQPSTKRFCLPNLIHKARINAFYGFHNISTVALAGIAFPGRYYQEVTYLTNLAWGESNPGLITIKQIISQHSPEYKIYTRDAKMSFGKKFTSQQDSNPKHSYKLGKKYLKKDSIMEINT